MTVSDLADDWRSRLRAVAPEQVAGLWFGLTELSPGGWHLYVAGTETFDLDDETAEWATGPYVWWPEHRYLAMPEVEEASVADAIEVATRVVRRLAPWADIEVDGIAVGFDDGDFVVIHPTDDQ